MRVLNSTIERLENPHNGGLKTEAYRFEASPGQVYAIDIGTVYEHPDRVADFGSEFEREIRIADAIAFALLFAGIILTFTLALWMWLPFATLAMLVVRRNKQQVGEQMAQLALEVSGAFMHLHQAGLVWLVQPRPR
ncbi:MAG: hypothetical protein AAFX02_11040 [Pseudomonadota bacterium]